MRRTKGVEEAFCIGQLAGRRTERTRRLGEGEQQPTTMDISKEQREGFLRVLQEAKNKKTQELQRALEKKVKDDLLPKIMQRQGIVKLIEEVKGIGHQLSESAHKLQGMDVFGRPATLWGKILGTNEGMEDVLEQMKRPFYEEQEQMLKDYDRATLQVLSATDLEDVQRIVNTLI